MSRALYRTHRPQKLSEVVGQEHITEALDRALKKGLISHAYLFTGPRGVGKTSIARILAHEINGLPYEDDTNYLDIIEIDAASNRRIDEIRDLRDKVHIAPSNAKFKVYIIDEVHMLTKEAFNALLKTLEEPPAHAVFILATTEAHKLPETIISRTQRFSFKPVDMQKVIGHLKDISAKEKISVTDDALALIAEHGEGSFRDSISLLDQIRNTGEKVALEDVQKLLGLAPKEHIQQILASINAHDAPGLGLALRQAAEQGYEPSQIAKQLAESLREDLLSGQKTLPREALINIMSELLNVPSSSNPRSYLEITLFDAALSGQPDQPAATHGPAPAPAQPPKPKVMAAPVQSKPPVITEPHPSSLRRAKAEDDQPSAAPTSTTVIGEDSWPEILAAIKAKHNTLFSIARTAQPSFGPGTITLAFEFAFHKKRLSEARNREILAEIVKSVTGEDVIVQCVVNEDASEPTPVTAKPAPKAVQPEPIPPAPPASASGSDAISSISNIFGSAEVLES